MWEKIHSAFVKTYLYVLWGRAGQAFSILKVQRRNGGALSSCTAIILTYSYVKEHQGLNRDLSRPSMYDYICSLI